MADIHVAITATIVHADGTTSVVGREARTHSGDNPIFHANVVTREINDLSAKVRAQVVAAFGDTGTAEER